MSKVIQVRDVPTGVHSKLKARAAAEGRTLSELVREQLVAAAQRPTMTEMLERLRAAEPVEAGETSAEAVRAGRAER